MTVAIPIVDILNRFRREWEIKSSRELQEESEWGTGVEGLEIPSSSGERIGTEWLDEGEWDSEQDCVGEDDKGQEGIDESGRE